MVEGPILFEGKPIIIDTFTDLQIEMEAAIDQTNAFGSITCKTKKRSFPLASCSFVSMEEGPVVIHQGTFYLSSSCIEWAILKRGWENELFELSHKEIERLKILLEENLKVSGSSQNTTPPVLTLTDPLGTCANLNEKQHEALLLKSDYIKKIIGLSHYFCPPDKVKKSIQTLKSSGFTIQDAEGRTILLMTDKHLNWSFEKEKLFLKGSLKFETQLLPIEKALQSKNRFYPLSQNECALLPDKDELGLNGETFEIYSESLAYPKTSVSLMYEEMREYNTPLQDFALTAPSSNFFGTLRPYQQIGVSWLHGLFKGGFSALLADDMGLGKTVQVLAFLSLIPGPHLIVVPKSLLSNWAREIERFLPQHQITLTTYSKIRDLTPETFFEALILDEAQAIKNSSTKTAQAAKGIKAKFRLSLSGTPIENHIDDLISQFDFLLPGMALPQDQKALFKKVRPFILRRTKQDVLKELPERDDQLIFVDMTEEQEQFYNKFLSQEKKKINELGATKEMEIFEVILRLRQIACHPLLVTDEAGTSGKLERVLDDLHSCMEEGSKVLVFSQFTKLLSLLKRELKYPYLYMDGETKDRQSIVDQFQNGQCPLLLSSLKVGGVGLNLTAADYVFILDPWWNEAVEEQAISRAHRMGRSSRVISRRYISKGTLEEQMLLMKSNKNALAAALFS